MNAIQTNWTKEELEIYLLIYCANADFTESKTEDNYIQSKAKHVSFDKIHAEFEKDNDYIRIQKIQHALQRHGYSQKEKEKLLQEMKEVFLADENFDVLEKNLYLGLKHIILG